MRRSRGPISTFASAASHVEFETLEGTSHLFGTYLEVSRPERLVYTFCWRGPPGEIPETQVTVEFHERGVATEIVITHERQPSSRVQEFHAWGWIVSLDRLSELLDRVVADSPRATSE